MNLLPNRYTRESASFLCIFFIIIRLVLVYNVHTVGVNNASDDIETINNTRVHDPMYMEQNIVSLSLMFVWVFCKCGVSFFNSSSKLFVNIL